MNLSINDRLAIIQLLPTTGSLTEVVDIIEIIKKVRVGQEEKDLLKFKETPESILWDSSLDSGKEIVFTHEEVAILKDAVKILDSKRLITFSNVDICLKIKNL